MTTTFTILGALQGCLWWPIGEPAQKPVSYAFKRTETPPPFVNTAETLREAVEGLMRDGDFSNAPRLTADSLLLVTRRAATYETRRWFPLASFSSIADYMIGGRS